MEHSIEEIIIQRNIAEIERERRDIDRLVGARATQPGDSDAGHGTFFFPNSETMKQKMLRKLDAYQAQLEETRKAI